MPHCHSYLRHNTSNRIENVNACISIILENIFSIERVKICIFIVSGSCSFHDKVMSLQSPTAVVSVQFSSESYVVNSEGMVVVAVEIDRRVAQPLLVTVLVSTFSFNTTAG